MTHERPVLVIEPTKGWVSLRLRELWQYHELIGFLAWRDITSRYKQTLVGAAWAIIQPVMMMVVFSLVFGKLAKLPSEGVPYPIFSYAALLPWQYFSTAASTSANSLVNNANLLTKVYFPRLVIPTASVLPAALDFWVAFAVLIGMMFYYGIAATWKIALLPLLFLLAVITALGFGIWFAALSIEYRDVRHVIPFAMQGLMFVSPVVYPSSMVPEQWRMLYSLNPMAGVIEGFRWCMLGTHTPAPHMLVVSIVVALVLLVSGAYYFRRMERVFADVV